MFIKKDKMKLLFSVLMLFAFITGKAAPNRMEDAEQKARAEHKYILLNFSGSDWCGPCIRMHREILDNEAFRKYADAHLVYINADFPRMKKHQLAADIQKENEELAETYNSKGTFPLTVLIDCDGKLIRQWDGFYTLGADAFTSEIKQLIEAKK